MISDGKIHEILEVLDWAQDNGIALFTSRQIRRRDMLECVKMGLAKYAGLFHHVDDCGEPQEHRKMRE